MTRSTMLHPLVLGGIGLIGMLVFYVTILALSSGDPLHPWYFFMDKWYYLTPIILGFAVQMWLFQRMRIVMRENQHRMAAASAGVSGAAMAACCAHHLADVLPLVGLASIATSVSAYQDVFLGAGVVMTVVGIGYMYYRFIQLTRMSCGQSHVA